MAAKPLTDDRTPADRAPTDRAPSDRAPHETASEDRQPDDQNGLSNSHARRNYVRRNYVRGVVAWSLALVGTLTCGGCQWAASGQNSTGARLYEQGQYSAALQQFQKVITTDPNNADGYYNLAATNHRLGNQRGDAAQLSQAESLYNQCLDHDPNHVECHRGLAVLLIDTGRPDRAFALMKNWAGANPDNAEPRIELARLYEEVADPATALKYLEDAVQKNPNNSRAWLALGRLREQSGDLNQAVQNYQRSLALNGLQPMASERIAVLSRQISANYEASIANGQTQIATQPSFGSGMVRQY